jgi:hypothetical protein
MHRPEDTPARERRFWRCLAAELRSTLTQSSASEAQLTDAAFALVRRLDAGILLGERCLGPLPPPRRAEPVETREAPVAGDLLVSHPLLRRDTVLLLSADGLDGHAMGLVTNAPTPAIMGGSAFGQASRRSRVFTTGGRTLNDPFSELRRTVMTLPPVTFTLTLTLPEPEPLPSLERVTCGSLTMSGFGSLVWQRDDDVQPFADHMIFAGGPDGGSNVTMLHPYKAVRGSVRVCDGLYYGGDLAHAADLVREEQAEARQFIFYKGRVDWRPGDD